MDKKIILASNSPRRQELLRGLDVEFTVDTGNTFEESMDRNVAPHDIPVLMARGKSHGFHRPLSPDEILITADTVVIVSTTPPSAVATSAPSGFSANSPESVALNDNSLPGTAEVLGKPHSREEAVQMLRDLSGRVHEVVTAVTIRDCNHEESFSDSTLVRFCELSDKDIEYYVDKYRPYDKAGAYGIQEWIGYANISGIEGSFYNVMGFPVHRVYAELKKFL